ncbi:MAG: preprotein translocase subunit SecY [Chitinophagales bacterium]|nr:preprotein translocase subunit SecY [Chitinophagales bacterium]
MKGFISTLKNIWQIEDLRNRILSTIGFIMIYRVGSYIVLPGIDPNSLSALEKQGQEGILGLLNIFTGGAFSSASIFALGIMPYISASIAIQLMTLAIPYFQKLQKEGESGRRQINQITRYLTVAITMAQAFGYIVNLKFIAQDAIVISSALFTVSTVVVLTAGTIFVMWLGEKITDKGIGNGISIIIMIGIIAQLPFALVSEFQSRVGEEGGGAIALLIELLVLVFIVVAVIALVQATRRIPVQYAKRIVGNKQYGGVRQYLPLKINAAGVMPIIFAQAIMFIPATVAQFFPAQLSDASGFLGALSDYTSPWYNIIYFTLVIMFTYFYTAIIVNPMQWADDLKKNSGFIPGVNPGKKTAEFIDAVMSRITLPGAIFLGLIAIMPAFARLGGVNSQFAVFFGGTSLLILVSVVLDTLQQVESHLLMRHYDGLMKSGRIKGRQAAGAAY